MNVKNSIFSIFTQLSSIYHHDVQESTFIMLDDCARALQSIKDNTIDVIFADPPYNIGKNLLVEKMTPEEYITWTRLWIDECLRILKPQGTLYYMTATQFMPYIDIYCAETYHVQQRIVWYYDSSGVQARKYFGSRYEPILMVVKDAKEYYFNAEAVQVEAKTGAKRKLIDYRKTPPQLYNAKKVMGNVWEIPRVRYRMDEYENHPTQKPEELLERIISASCPPGGIVLDPFAGSFTTCKVAQKLQRKTIGIEINKEWYKIGLRRLNIAQQFEGDELVKQKTKKTKNKTKKDHNLSFP